jgi:hypothetical protein
MCRPLNSGFHVFRYITQSELSSLSTYMTARLSLEKVRNSCAMITCFWPAYMIVHA